MIGSHGTLRKLLLATTAVGAVAMGGGAAAQTAIAEVNADGTINIDDILDAVIAQSQIATGADIVAEEQTIVSRVTGTMQETIDDPALNAPQTLAGNDIVARTRLNIATSTVDVQGTALLDDYAGETRIDPTATGTNDRLSITSGLGIASLQLVEDIGVGTAGGAAATATGTMQILVDAVDAGTGGTGTDAGALLGRADLTLSGNTIVADTLLNDAANTILATGANGDALAIPAAIASLQQVLSSSTGTGTGAATDFSVLSTATGLVTIDVDNAESIASDLLISNNAVAARTGLNQVANTLQVGNSNGGPALGGVGGELNLFAGFDAAHQNIGTASDGFVNVNTGVLELDADYGIANVQIVGDEGITAGSTVANARIIITDNDATDAGSGDGLTGSFSIRNNTVLAETTANTADNRAFVTTSEAEPVSVGVASLQILGTVTGTGTGAVYSGPTILATVDSGTGTDATAILATVSDMGADSSLSITGNRIEATAMGNEAFNVAALTAHGAESASQVGLVGMQTSLGTDLSALVGDDANNGVSITATVANVAEADARLDVVNNRIGATASLNEQTNIAQLTQHSALRGADAFVTGRQEAIESTVDATVGESTLTASITGGAVGNPAVLNLSGNRVLADASANTQTNQMISNGDFSTAPSSMMITGVQRLEDTFVLASIQPTTIEATSAQGSDVSATLVNNRIAATASGNVSTSTISSRAPGFSFSR